MLTKKKTEITSRRRMCVTQKILKSICQQGEKGGGSRQSTNITSTHCIREVQASKHVKPHKHVLLLDGK